MNAFIIHSGADEEFVKRHLDTMKRKVYSFNPLLLKNGGRFWKIDASKKIKKSQMIIFFVGEDSHQSQYIAWEIKEARRFNKVIIVIKLDEQFELHDALLINDDFSGEKKYCSKSLTIEETIKKISDHSNGVYNVLNVNPNEVDINVLLEQYKVFLSTSEALVERRQNVNNFYITINTIIISLAGTIIALDIELKYKMIIGIIIGFIGFILSISWMNILVSYGNLNSSKMKIISLIEKYLPASLYDTEWEALSDTLNNKKYISFTDNEKFIPKIFVQVYIAIFISFLIYSFVKFL